MPKTYYYKLTIDNGGAPCVQDHLLSLAICKPTIRRCAQPGDWVVGFGANSFCVVSRQWPNGRPVPGNPLIFMARVTTKELDGTYYLDGNFSNRADCIYERQGTRFQRRNGALYHEAPERLQDDLGTHPNYPKSSALLSEDFRYFSGGIFDHELKFPAIKQAFDRVHRQYGVALPGTELAAHFSALQRWLWAKSEEGVTGAEPKGTLGEHAGPPARSCVVPTKSHVLSSRRKTGGADC